PGKEAERVDDGRDLLGLRGCEGLAHVLRLQARELVAVVLDGLREPEHALAAVARRAVAPAIVEGLARGVDGLVHVCLRAPGHVGDDLAGRGVDDLLIAAARAWSPLAADVHLVASERRAHFSLLPLYLSMSRRRARRRVCRALPPADRREWSVASGCG